MSDPFWVGLQPQSLHNGMVCDQVRTKDFNGIQKSGANTGGGNGVMPSTYAHPLHMIIVKHFAYVSYGYMVHSGSGRVSSINHFINCVV